MNLLYSHHIGSNRHSGFRSFTPGQVADNNELQSKARTWIRRELRVFGFLTQPSPPQQPVNLEWLLEFIICILRNVDLKDMSDIAHDTLTETLGRENARLFLHELSSWMRSPYRYLLDWDRVMDYGPDPEHRFRSYEQIHIGYSFPRRDLWPTPPRYLISILKR